jgi:PAS domain S-box-containing protein
MTYETFLSCVHPDDREYVDNKWQAALQGEEYDIEHRIIVGNEVRWVREKAGLEFDEQGMLKGGFGTTQDITERKQIDKQLEFRNSILSQVNDIVIAVDNEERVTYFNKAAEDTYHVEVEDALGQKLTDIYQYRWLKPEDEQNANDSLAKNGFWTGENIHVKKDGDEIVVESMVNILKDYYGATSGVLAVIRDITERKKADEQMAFQVRLLDAIEDCILAADAERYTTYWNKGAENLLGWHKEEIMARNAVDLLVPEEYSQEAETIEKMMRSGESWSGEIAFKHRNGNLVPLLARFSPVMDASGKLMDVMVVGKDISELKKVDQMKDEFIGLVSHELRTPLTVITGSLESAMHPRVSPEDARELIQNAVEGAESLASILENMLELSRYRAGRLYLKIGPVVISDVAQSVVQKLKSQGVGHRFSLDFPGDLDRIEADPMRVERILYNLLENATKYSPDESEILISSRNEGDFVVTKVTDQGQGISPDDQKKLFALFERLEMPTLAKGAGLGLVVCKRLVEAQEGWIKVDSQLGKGSTFTFALPIRSKKAQSD